jgi:hypothetical protein
MTLQDEQKTRQLISDVIGKPLAEIIGELKLQSQVIKTIDENTTKTNGKVAEHEKIIRNLLDLENGHFVKCPNTDKIITLEKMEVGRKAISSFTWKQVTLGGVIAGLIISLAQLLMK